MIANVPVALRTIEIVIRILKLPRDQPSEIRNRFPVFAAYQKISGGGFFVRGLRRCKRREQD